VFLLRLLSIGLMNYNGAATATDIVLAIAAADDGSDSVLVVSILFSGNDND
jgi:hypothetical protein